MKMLQPSSTAPFAQRLGLALLALLAAGPSTAAADEHTDFPDLSIIDPGKPRPPRNIPVTPTPPSIQPIIGHIIEWTVSNGDESESGVNAVIAPPAFPKPPIGPVVNTTLFTDSALGNGSSIPGGTSGVPAPGVGGLLLVGAALTARRRR